MSKKELEMLEKFKILFKSSMLKGGITDPDEDECYDCEKTIECKDCSVMTGITARRLKVSR